MSEKKYIITEVDYLGDTGSNTARLLLPGSIREYNIPRSLLIDRDRVAYVERTDGTAHYIIKPAYMELRYKVGDRVVDKTRGEGVIKEIRPFNNNPYLFSWIEGEVWLREDSIEPATEQEEKTPEDEWEAWEADMPVRGGRKSKWVDAMLEWLMDRPREVE